MKRIFKIIAWVLLALLVVLTFAFLWNKSKAKAKNYQIEEVVTQDSIESKTIITGTIEPRDEVLIKPQMSGIVAELMHKAGDFIQSGEVIARLTVVPEMVQLNSAESRVRLAEIAYNNGKETFGRDEKLFEKGVVAKEEFQKSQTEYARLKEELINAQEALEIVRKGVSSRMAKQSNTLVRSTVTGKILDLPIKVGNSVIQSNNFNDGTTIASVANMNELLFVGKVDETEVGRIRIGNPVRITVGALGTETFPATIEFIAPKGVVENGAILFQVKAAVQIPNEHNVRAGYSANADIVLDAAYDALALPEGCIEYSNDSTFVQVVKGSDTEAVERRAVKTGVSDGKVIEIKQGLKKGERVRGLEIVAK